MRIRLYHRAQKTLALGDIDLLETWTTEESTMVWVDVSGPLDTTAQQLLRDCFGLHELTLLDAR